jgi:hypothetical protein
VDAISEGLRGSGLQERLDALETRKAALERTLAATTPPVVRLHPDLADIYAKQVANLQEALSGPDGTEALERTRELIERVVIHPTATGAIEIELIGALGAMLSLALGRKAAGDRVLFESSAKSGCGGTQPTIPSFDRPNLNLRPTPPAGSRQCRAYRATVGAPESGQPIPGHQRPDQLSAPLQFRRVRPTPDQRRPSPAIPSSRSFTTPQQDLSLADTDQAPHDLAYSRRGIGCRSRS